MITLTIGEIIDRLITQSHKCYHAQDKIMDPSLSPEERLKAAEMAQATNAERSRLVQEIDKLLGQSKSPLVDDKTYHRGPPPPPLPASHPDEVQKGGKPPRSYTK